MSFWFIINNYYSWKMIFSFYRKVTHISAKKNLSFFFKKSLANKDFHYCLFVLDSQHLCKGSMFYSISLFAHNCKFYKKNKYDDIKIHSLDWMSIWYTRFTYFIDYRNKYYFAFKCMIMLSRAKLFHIYAKMSQLI